MKATKNILLAPLNWGLGHSTRCIPIIRELESQGYTPIIASDGMALQLLQIEFPHLQFLELPSYGIKYPKNGMHFRLQMMLTLPKIWMAMRLEKDLIARWHEEFQFCGIISDNRLGVHLKSVPSVYITHQLHVLSGFTTLISSKLHRKIIRKFDECWIPDLEFRPNLSFKLGHVKDKTINKKYIGPLSRFTPERLPIIFEIIIIISGPEPQRTMLTTILQTEMKKFNGRVLMVLGNVESNQKIDHIENMTIYNYMDTNQLQTAINQSDVVVCRSGYTSVMDLSVLQKKCFLIPTPGQFEQEYLAKKYQAAGFAPCAEQKNFTLADLANVPVYTGFPNPNSEPNWKDLFGLFNSK